MNNSFELDLRPNRRSFGLDQRLVQDWNGRSTTLDLIRAGNIEGDFETPEFDEPYRERCTATIPGWKRVLDIALVAITLPVWGPLFLAIAAFIKLCSTGPIFFRQERIGFRGTRFICLKFRSMKVGSDTAVHKHHLKNLMSSDAPMVKMDARGDKRLIPFGSILRSTGLDELPQLINVLRGEMSLVGPRPCIPYEYEDFLPWQKERCDALPGLTGLWQVSGKNRTTFTEMIRLDIQYAHTQSIWLDLRIIVGTVPAIVTQVLDTRKSKRTQRVNVTSFSSASQI